MPIEVVMPKLGLNMTSGTLIGWAKRPGELVRKGEPFFTVETEKATVEAEAPADGTVGRILVAQGETVPVGQVVAILLSEGEAPLPVESLPDAYPGASQSPEPVPASTSGVPSPVAVEREIHASPAAKRLARDSGIDLRAVRGTGAGGRISREDVERHLREKEAGTRTEGTAEALQVGSRSVVLESLRPGETVGMVGVRAIIADRMTRSLGTSAQFTLHSEVNATALVELRERLRTAAQGTRGSPPSYDAILVYLVSRALREHPYMNARLDGNVIRCLDDVHMGVALDAPAGLFVVVVRNADKKSVQVIHAELSEMAERARAGKATPVDLEGSTFTISNMGPVGVDSFTPIINPPEAAVLGIGKIAEKLVIESGQVSKQHRMVLSLTIDHRLVDGAPAARFLKRVAELCSRPESLMGREEG